MKSKTNICPVILIVGCSIIAGALSYFIHTICYTGVIQAFPLVLFPLSVILLLSMDLKEHFKPTSTVLLIFSSMVTMFLTLWLLFTLYPLEGVSRYPFALESIIHYPALLALSAIVAIISKALIYPEPMNKSA